ncbi:MAG TPA: DNA-formamidopyrimidine glycosylase family protein [Actinomycetota bacterium]|nr:DNA-formamidopyrimidine glycosylase family protein [Actinomycetota bacterium]
MPEGDTIHGAAERLRTAFGSDALASFEGPRVRGPQPAPGSPMHVTARGKHLLVGFDGGVTLHTHLGMDGWWRVERSPGRAVPRGGPPGRGLLARLSTQRASAVVGGTPTVELLTDAELRRHPVLRTLGPDLCDETIDLDEIELRLGGLDPDTPIGVVLLDQRSASGIGNVYRSEVLWAERVAPRVRLADVGPDVRRTLYTTAHRLLRANIGRPRRTIPSGLAAYDRAGRACPRCRTPIRAERLGEQARTVWWCPTCQATDDGPARRPVSFGR